MAESPWSLQLKASTLRGLMNIGMALHKLPSPRPPRPSFARTIPVTVSPRPGTIELFFYTPPGYALPPNPPPSLSSSTPASQTPQPPTTPPYPVLISFHGGGFTLGHPTDDARFFHAATTTCNAVVVSVGYRLAPEYPFPTAVEDGVDAVLWIVAHAAELGINPERVALCGFSAGGNLAVTVPLRLRAEVEERGRVRVRAGLGEEAAVLGTVGDGEWRGRMVGALAFYPVTDFATHTRAERRLTNPRPEKGLPQFFTHLFDASYISPPGTVALDNPYLSPAVAPADLLRGGLPEDVLIYTCEYDELLEEGKRFAERLGGEEVGKRVRYRMVEGVPHAWDKGVNPLWVDEKTTSVYKEVCEALKEVFEKAGERKGGGGL